MSNFDPYQEWLGISVIERPISKYRLLGIAEFESDPNVITQAADQRTAYLRHFQSGDKTPIVIDLVNEVAGARATLLNPVKKMAYDNVLIDRPKQSLEAVASITTDVKIRKEGSSKRMKRNASGKRWKFMLLSVVLGGLASVPLSLLVLKYLADVDVLGLWKN